MSRNSLDTLKRFRRSLCEDARKALEACQEAEEAAGMVLHRAEAAIMSEQVAAMAPDAPDGAVESFVAWLPHGRQAVGRAREAQESAVAATVQARAVLASARASAEAVEKLIEERAAAQKRHDLKVEQAELDELARRPAR